MVNITDLEIDDVTMPSPALDGVDISYEPLWSADTGRLADGTMAGTIIAIKIKLSIKWPALAPYDAAKLKAKICTTIPFHKIKFRDESGQVKSYTVYFSAPSFQLYSWVPGIDWVHGISVDAIEK